MMAAVEGQDSIPVKDSSVGDSNEWIGDESDFWGTWGVRVLVTLVLAFLWHYYWMIPRRANKQQRQSKVETRGRSRLLDEIPNDLMLQESIEAEDNTSPSAKEDKLLNQNSHESDRDTSTEKKKDEEQVQDEEATKDNNKAKKKDDSDKKSLKKNQVSQPVAKPDKKPPPFQPQNDDHPGLKEFWYWCDVESSLFRIYSVGRTDDVPVIPPYIPNSRRGQVSVHLKVTNATPHKINVYWVNYQGREDSKGIIQPGSTWDQFTWIEHPWVFRNEQDEVLLYYIPDRVIPTVDEAPTVDANDPDTGIQRFTIGPPDARSIQENLCICIDDPILPFPAHHHFETPTQAISWTLLHCRRMGYRGWRKLIKYLTMIVEHPEEPKYRQIRTANAVFKEHVWNTPARGVMLAVGFCEQGAYAELGTAAPLAQHRVQDVALLLFQVERAMEAEEGPMAQPSGADGFGRAGFGRAGTIN